MSKRLCRTHSSAVDWREFPPQKHQYRGRCKTQNFWDKSKQINLFDVRIFNSHAPVNCSSSTDACYRRHEREKRRAYEQRVLEVEHDTFTPLVLSTSGGWGLSAMVAFKRLAGPISDKCDQPYSSTLSFIRCKITFSLIDSAISCLRAPRSTFHAPARDFNLTDYPLDLICAEVQLEGIPMASGPAAIFLDSSKFFTEGESVRIGEHVIVDSF